MGAPLTKASEAAAQKEALVREILERVGDKWTLLVIEGLGEGGELRFTQLRDRMRVGVSKGVVGGFLGCGTGIGGGRRTSAGRSAGKRWPMAGEST